MDIQRTGMASAAAAAAVPPRPATADASAAARPAVQQVPVDDPTAVSQPASVPNTGQVAQAVKAINKALQEQGQGVEFTIDSETDRTIVKVVDVDTKEVLRQIPSEEVLEIAKALDQAQGLLIRQKA